MILSDFQCLVCSHIWEELLDHSEQFPKQCPSCSETKSLLRIYSAKHTKLNSMEAVSDCLKKRSADHSRKELAKLAGHKGALPKDLGKNGNVI